MKNRLIKTLTTRIAALLVLVCFGLLTGCKKDDPTPVKTEADIVTEMLVAEGSAWSPVTVTVDGVDVTSALFDGFSIKFSETTFTTTGTSPVWLRQDTWSFKDETATVMIRGQDDKELTIQDISDTQLRLTLEWDKTTTDADEGRAASLKGKHEFILNK